MEADLFLSVDLLNLFNLFFFAEAMVHERDRDLELRAVDRLVFCLDREREV